MERNEVVQAIQQLSFIYREALVLRFYEDLSIRGIAEALGIPEGTVKSRLHTAVRRLKEVMLKGGDVACRSGA
jgi:RNA polymerase sigma-70 factor (ECF subfamily)